MSNSGTKMKSAIRKPRGMPEEVAQGIRIMGRMSGRPSILYLCKKAGGIIALEAPAEKTVAQLADLDPRIVSVQAQPFTIDVLIGRIFTSREDLLAARLLREKNEVKIREYTPDFLLVTIDGRWLVIEVKLENFPGDAMYWEKIEVAKKILRMHGYEFILVTIDREPGSALTQNADLLTAFTSNYEGQISSQQIQTAQAMLEFSPKRLGEVCQTLGISLRESPTLILRGVVKLDLVSARVSAASQIANAYGDIAHLQVLPFGKSRP